jgi:competence protein ComEC
MRLILLGFCVGVISLVQFSFVPSPLIVLCMGLSFVLVLYMTLGVVLKRITAKSAFKKWPYWLLLMGYCLGLAWASVDARQGLENRLSPHLEGTTMTLSVQIKGIPVRETIDYPDWGDKPLYVWRFNARVLAVVAPHEVALTDSSLNEGHEAQAVAGIDQLPHLMKLSWFAHTPQPLRPDQRWRLTVKLKRPHGYANRGGFDYEKWLFANHIGATGSVVAGANNQMLSEASFSLDRLRQDIGSILFSRFQSFETAALLPALVVADRTYISDQQWDVLRQTGTSHLFAISGLHIGLVFSFVYACVNLVMKRCFWLARLVAIPKLSAGLGLSASLVYSALAGFSIPTLRALMMLAVIVLYRVLDRQRRLMDALLIALVMVLFFLPRSPLEVGFWLSFLAVFVIFWVISGRFVIVSRPFVNVVYSLFRIQMAVFLGLMPVLLLLFGALSWVSPFVNMVAVPFVSLFLLPAVFIGVALFLMKIPLSYLLLEGVFKVFDHCWWWLKQIAQTQPSILLPMSDSALLALSAMAAVLILLAPKAIPHQWLAVLLLVSVLYPKTERIEEGELRMAVLDVGQGLSVLLQTRQHNVLFDTGDRFSSGSDMGDSVILPYLRQQSVDRLDALIISHKDRDHIGGAETIIEQMPVDRLIGAQIDFLSAKVQRPFRHCRSELNWHWDGVTFQFLNPTVLEIQMSPFSSQLLKKGVVSANNQSCVLKVVGDGFSVLIPGDIERPMEAFLLTYRRQALNADILIAPHHGSHTSSSTGFINAVSPHDVIFTAGYRNRFHHPNPDVVARYRTRRARVLDTSLTGTIEYHLGTDAGLVKPLLYREQRSTYWGRAREMQE